MPLRRPLSAVSPEGPDRPGALAPGMAALWFRTVETTDEAALVGIAAMVVVVCPESEVSAAAFCGAGRASRTVIRLLSCAFPRAASSTSAAAVPLLVVAAGTSFWDCEALSL